MFDEHPRIISRRDILRRAGTGGCCGRCRARHPDDTGGRRARSAGRTGSAAAPRREASKTPPPLKPIRPTRSSTA